MEGEKAIKVNGVTKKYDNFTLDNISFTLPKGYIMGVIGENGAGKTTLINLIMNTVKKDSGQIEVMGMNNESAQFSEMKNRIGVVLDEASFPIAVTANVVNRMMKSIYTDWSESIFAGYMEKFNLPWNKAFNEFSKGMKMKLSIAVALSHYPKLLILDEPTGGLDPIARDELLEVFYDFTRDEEHSILISSHIISDLEKLCDYIAFVHRGKLLFCEEKDVLSEKYGILKCTFAQEADVPEEAVAGKRRGEYNAEFLVERSKVSDVFDIEKADIEDIMLYMVKED